MDWGKPGSKMHVLSDAKGLPLRVGLSAANTHDSLALKSMLSHFHTGHESLAIESKPQRLHAPTCGIGYAAGVSACGSPAKVSSPANDSVGIAGDGDQSGG
ncbi:hypothetical protein BX257_1371 [Streptomyces sp. 3212.3]|nr:hypothetical protein BX257_1371 [Streptomyces sp. 3212.3]